MTGLHNSTNRILTNSFAALAPNVHWAQRLHRTVPDHFERRILDFELLYIQQGEICASLEGKSFLVQAGGLFYIPAGVRHGIAYEKEIRAYGVHFDYFGEMVISGENDSMVIKKTQPDPVLCLEPEFPITGLLLNTPVVKANQKVVDLMELLIEEYNHRKLGHELICRGLMLQILYYLHHSQQEPLHQSRYSDMILSIAQRMEIEYAYDWSLGRVAGELNLQRDYAAKLFKETVGLPPIKYIQHIRHREAKRLLRETDEGLSVIASQVGYDDLHYFSRIFNKLEGISPGHYRKLTRIL